MSTKVDPGFWDRNIVDIAHNYDEIFLNSGTLVFYAISARRAPPASRYC